LTKISCLKFTAVLILFCDIAFVVTVGDKSSDAKGSYDALLRQNHPEIYLALSTVGFRMTRDPDDPTKAATPEQLVRYNNIKFTAYVSFLLISLILQGGFNSLLNDAKFFVDMKE
jgi:hypothetical protein